MTTHRTTHTHRSTRTGLASKLGVALLSTVALGTVMAGTAAASAHDGPGELVATSTPPEPEPQPQPEVDDKDGPVECTDFDVNLVDWQFELDDDGTHVLVTISYADDYDTCTADLAVATWSLPSADADRTDPDAMTLNIWEPSINEMEAEGSLALSMQFVGCYNEVAILFGPTTIADEKFVDLCPVIDQPVDTPDDSDVDSGAGQPGGPDLPSTGTASTVLAAIAGLLLAIGIALTGAGRRREKTSA